MKKTLLFLVILIIGSALWAQQKYALIIGNGAYTNFGSLPNAVNDANDMETALKGLNFTVDKVLNGNRAQIVEAITRFKNRLSVSKSSYGFFFYAGHAVQYNGVNYLIPAKADIPNANYLGDTSISVQTMLAELNDAGNELNVVVLDACRDFPAAWTRSTNRGLTVVANQPADSIIVYATSAGSTASDGTGRNGLFTSQLLKNLKTPGLEVSEVFRQTGADVSQASNRQQIPAVYNQFFGRAYLGTTPVAATPVVQPAPAAAPVVQPAPVAAPVASAPAVQPAPQTTPVTATPAAPPAAPTVSPDSKYIVLADAQWRSRGLVQNSQWSSRGLVENSAFRSTPTTQFNIASEKIAGYVRDVLTLRVSIVGAFAEQAIGEFILENRTMIQQLQIGSGVRFKVLGDGKKWKLQIPTKEAESDSCFYETAIATKKGKVVEVDIPYLNLKQPAWGNKVTFLKDSITWLVIQRDSRDGGTGTSTIKVFDFEIY